MSPVAASAGRGAARRNRLLLASAGHGKTTRSAPA